MLLTGIRDLGRLGVHAGPALRSSLGLHVTVAGSLTPIQHVPVDGCLTQKVHPSERLHSSRQPVSVPYPEAWELAWCVMSHVPVVNRTSCPRNVSHSVVHPVQSVPPDLYGLEPPQYPWRLHQLLHTPFLSWRPPSCEPPALQVLHRAGQLEVVVVVDALGQAYHVPVHSGPSGPFSGAPKGPQPQKP